MENQEITLERLMEMLSVFNGKNAFGDANALISYQSFAAEEDDESLNKKSIYNITNRVTCDFSVSKMHPGFVSLDLIFNSCDDAELKLMWGRLQRMRKNEQEHPELTHIFHINLVEADSISENTEVNDMLHICHVLNPIMFYLTRDMPSSLAINNVVNDEMTGGNILRMLIPIQYITIEVSDEYNTRELKGEVEREIEAENYINNYVPPVDDGTLW